MKSSLILSQQYSNLIWDSTWYLSYFFLWKNTCARLKLIEEWNNVKNARVKKIICDVKYLRISTLFIGTIIVLLARRFVIYPWDIRYTRFANSRGAIEVRRPGSRFRGWKRTIGCERSISRRPITTDNLREPYPRQFPRENLRRQRRSARHSPGVNSITILLSFPRVNISLRRERSRWCGRYVIYARELCAPRRRRKFLYASRKEARTRPSRKTRASAVGLGRDNSAYVN